MFLITSCEKEVEIKAMHPSSKHIVSTVSSTTSGTVYAKNQALLSFAISGRIKDVLVEAGDRVRKGQILALLENDDLEQKCRNAIDQYNRDKSLYKNKAISPEALQQSRLALEQAKCNLEKSIILAPFNGITVRVNMQKGELVTPGMASLEKNSIFLIDEKPRTVKAPIDELDLEKIKEGQRTLISIPAFRKKPLEAKVSSTVPFVSTARDQDRTSEVEFIITEKTKKLIPIGASADAEIIVSEINADIAIPSKLILGTLNDRYVLKIGSKNLLVKQAIKLGIRNYEWSEIVSGLSLQDKVAIPSEKVNLSEGLKVKYEMMP